MSSSWGPLGVEASHEAALAWMTCGVPAAEEDATMTKTRWQVEGRDEAGNWDTYAVGGPEVAQFEEEPSEEQLEELARCLGCSREDVRAVDLGGEVAEDGPGSRP